MRTRSLRETLGLVTALAAAACGGRIAPDGASGPSSSSPGPNGAAPPPADDVCPYTVEIRGFDVTVSSETACTLAADAPPCFGSYCQPAGKDCAAPCGDPAVNACTLPSSYLADFKLAQRDAGPTCPPADAMTLHCSVNERRGTKTNGCPVEGRRPSGLVPFAASNDEAALGAYFAECEWLEAASIVAFEELACELVRVGAPSALVGACRAAANDEARHARSMAALRTRFGGFHRPVATALRASRSLFELAAENAVEGLVRETYGAAVALWRAARVADPDVRRALEIIAEDECRHAELARQLASFFEARLTASQRAAVARLESEAIHALARELDEEPAERLSAIAGVPRAREARAILDSLVRELWPAAA